MDRWNPQYEDEQIALRNSSHIDRPSTTARAPQFIPDNYRIIQTYNDGPQKPAESCPVDNEQDRDVAQMEQSKAAEQGDTKTQYEVGPWYKAGRGFG